ncbi:hypothetical protein MMC26_002614 [Xylographa opegraphella]|nr:hypothetical protein [Xylographa opegraphella]
MWQDNEPSILEYARFYGLTVDHRHSHPLAEVPQSLSTASSVYESDVLEISKDLGTIATERLELEKGAAIFLVSITNTKNYASSAGEDSLPKTHRVRDLKFELPLLKSDHELDLRQFVGRIVPDLSSERLPLENLKDDLDEGLGLQSSYDELYVKVSAKYSVEKLAIPKDALLYLRDTIQQLKPGDEQPRHDYHFTQYQRSTVRDPITPPLLPMSPEIVPFVPSSEVGYLDLLSEHSSPFRDELRDLDRSILAEDTIEPNFKSSGSGSKDVTINSDTIEDLYSPLKRTRDPPSPPIIRRSKAACLKVDGPLTPPRSELPPPWKSKNVSFSETLVQIIPDLLSQIPNPKDTSSEDIDRFFAEVVRPIAEQADRWIEQEQLQEADTTIRVKVPIMDFARPIAPWKQFLTEKRDFKLQGKLLQEIKHDHLSNCFWPLSGKAERALQWSPFPSNLARVAIEEFIDDDPALEELITQPELIDPMTLVWKLDGIRIMDSEDSDTAEIEVGHFPETVDMKSLIRKRKMDLQEDMINSGLVLPSKVVKDDFHDGLSNNYELFGSFFSALSALDHFTSIRTGEVKRKRLETSSYLAKGTDIARPEPHPTINSPAVISIHTPLPSLDRPPISLPEFIIPSSPRAFVIPTSLLLKRPLFRLIQKLYPTAEFIERDFTLHSTPSVPFVASKQYSKPLTPTSPLLHEADIILSPSTGLFLATLAQIAQRPLPGSTGLPPIYDRILHTAPRYESLIILVSDLSAANTGITTSLAPLRSLHAFCASLPLSTPPSIIFVPASTPTAPSSHHEPLLPLATYTIHLMTTHSLPSEIISLSPTAPTALRLHQEETTWEVFLRRAGLNAFAAQAVLAALRPPVLNREWGELDAQAAGTNGVSVGGVFADRRGWTVKDRCGEESTLWGLAAFVRMGPEERIRRFEGLLGGRGMLERVGRALDERWG